MDMAPLGELLEFYNGRASARVEDGEFVLYGSNGRIGRSKSFNYENAIILGRVGAYCGSVEICHDKFWASDNTIVVKAKGGNNLRYIYYRLLSTPLRSYAGGAAQPLLTQTILRGVKIQVVKDLSVQKQIADILSAYDDLIENNRRRIQLLELAARLLYKEWFVNFRFPGHEHVKIKDGVPEGWEKVPVSSFCEVRRGASPRPINNFMGGTVPWFKIGDATASESLFIFKTKEMVTQDGAGKSVLLPAEELILSNSATCGVPYFTGVSGCIHDGWLYFKNLKRVDKWFLYCCLFLKQRELLQGIGEGATQKNLNTDYVGRQLVLLPKRTELLVVFREKVEAMFKQIFVLAKANGQLREACEILLPRLMNGEVAV